MYIDPSDRSLGLDNRDDAMGTVWVPSWLSFATSMPMARCTS